MHWLAPSEKDTGTDTLGERLSTARIRVKELHLTELKHATNPQ